MMEKYMTNSLAEKTLAREKTLKALDLCKQRDKGRTPVLICAKTNLFVMMPKKTKNKTAFIERKKKLHNVTD